MSARSLGPLAPKNREVAVKWVSWYISPCLPDRYGMFLLLSQLGRLKRFIYVGGGGVLRNHWLQAKPATVNFRKSFGLSLFVCHAKSSSTGALRPHHLSGSGHLSLRFPIWMLPCDSPPTSSQQRSGEISSWKRQDAALSGCFLQSLAFLNRCDQYDHNF